MEQMFRSGHEKKREPIAMKRFAANQTRSIHLLQTGLCLLILLFLSSPLAFFAEAAEDREVIVCFGHSRIYKDTTAAKKEAVSRALLKTVQSAALKMIAKDDLTGHFELIATVLDKHRDAFIQDYRILKEFQTDKAYHVLVEATVSGQKIEKAFADAGFDLSPKDLPSVLLMVAEKNIDDIGFNYWWKQGYADFSGGVAEPVIRRAFSGNGFAVISPDPDSGALDDELLASGMGAEPADYQAALVAGRMGADLVVLGRARVKTLENRMGQGVRSFRADVQLNIIDAETGEKLASVTEKALNVSDDPDKGSKKALADAAYAAASQLSEQTVSLWRNIEKHKQTFQIRIRGQRILPYLERLRAAIRQHPGVSDLQTTEMTSANAVLEMHYTRSAQQLANHLLMQSFDGFGINILKISPKTLHIELIPG